MRNVDSLRGWTTVAGGVLLALGPVIAGCTRESAPPAPAPAPPPFAGPALARYEAMRIPADNPMTTAKVELGKQLYYDTRLSGDGQRSCYSCHVSEKGLTDGQPVAIGAFNRKLTRSSPTMWNIGYHSEWYWDGRAKTLEGQAKAAWSGGNMGASGKEGAPGMDAICATLNQVGDYKRMFQEVFKEGCTQDNVPKALAAFMRTIVSTDSPWIRFRDGDTNALSESARRGYQVFDVKAQCSKCHSGLLLTDQQYHNVGVGMTAKEPDVGRYTVTKEERMGRLQDANAPRCQQVGAVFSQRQRGDARGGSGSDAQGRHPQQVAGSDEPAAGQADESRAHGPAAIPAGTDRQLHHHASEASAVTDQARDRASDRRLTLTAGRGWAGVAARNSGLIRADKLVGASGYNFERPMPHVPAYP